MPDFGVKIIQVTDNIIVRKGQSDSYSDLVLKHVM